MSSLFRMTADTDQCHRRTDTSRGKEYDHQVQRMLQEECDKVVCTTRLSRAMHMPWQLLQSSLELAEHCCKSLCVTI